MRACCVAVNGLSGVVEAVASVGVVVEGAGVGGAESSSTLARLDDSNASLLDRLRGDRVVRGAVAACAMPRGLTGERYFSIIEEKSLFFVTGQLGTLFWE